MLMTWIPADLLPAPVNVQLRRLSSTSVEVSWDAPRYPGVFGYRVYHHITTTPDINDGPSENLDRWTSIEIGPYTSAEINGLEPNAVYAVKVRARGLDGRYGNVSETAWTKRRDYG